MSPLCNSFKQKLIFNKNSPPSEYSLCCSKIAIRFERHNLVIESTFKDHSSLLCVVYRVFLILLSAFCDTVLVHFTYAYAITSKDAFTVAALDKLLLLYQSIKTKIFLFSFIPLMLLLVMQRQVS